MPYDFTELNTTLDNAPRPYLLRLHHDLAERMFRLEQHHHKLSESQHVELEAYQRELRQAAQANQLNTQQLNAYKTFWDTRGLNPTYQMVGMMFDFLSPDAMPIEQHFRELLLDYRWAIDLLIGPEQRPILNMDSFNIGYEEERWINDRLKWLLTHPQDALWELEQAPKAQRLEYFKAIELVELIKQQRTYHPRARTTFTATIDQPTDTRRVWLCHIPELNISYIPIAEPSNYLSRPTTSFWYEDLTWSHATVRVSEPEHPAAFIMIKQA